MTGTPNSSATSSTSSRRMSASSSATRTTCPLVTLFCLPSAVPCPECKRRAVSCAIERASALVLRVVAGRQDHPGHPVGLLVVVDDEGAGFGAAPGVDRIALLGREP